MEVGHDDMKLSPLKKLISDEITTAMYKRESSDDYNDDDNFTVDNNDYDDNDDDDDDTVIVVVLLLIAPLSWFSRGSSSSHVFSITVIIVP